jgi:uncharacterized protein YkwD
MKWGILALGAILLIFAISIFTVPDKSIHEPTEIPSPTPIQLDSMRIYNLVNDYRASKSLNKLTFDPSMCDYTKIRLSQIHTDFSHSGYKLNPFPYGKSYGYTGENLIQGYPSEQDTVDAWIASPKHLENIIKPAYTRTCVSSDSYHGQTYVVQEFASY